VRCRAASRSAGVGLQVPADYISVLQVAVPQALRSSGVDPCDVVGIVPTSRCTMVATLADGTPLCEVPEYSTSPHAFVKLLAPPRRTTAGRPDQRAGAAGGARRGWRAMAVLSPASGSFAKGLQMLEEAPQLYAAMDASSRQRTGSCGS